MSERFNEKMREEYGLLLKSYKIVQPTSWKIDDMDCIRVDLDFSSLNHDYDLNLRIHNINIENIPQQLIDRIDGILYKEEDIQLTRYIISEFEKMCKEEQRQILNELHEIFLYKEEIEKEVE